MMISRNFSAKPYSAFLALALLPSLAAQATESAETFSWQGDLEAGYLYDSNVNIRELDTTTNNADRAWLVKASLAAKWNPIQPLTVKAGVNHSDQRYDTYDDFDLAITTIHADLSYDFNLLTVGLSNHRADAKLAGDSFMDYTQNTLYASRLWTNQWFTRIEWRDIDKTFATNSERNAQATAYSADVYWFTPSANSFINIGYGVHDETATNNLYSYDGDELRVKWQTKEIIGEQQHTWQIAWQRSTRDYQQLQPDLTAPRYEQRQSVRAQWQLPLMDALVLTPHVEYVDNQSNVDAVDYHETVAGVNLTFSF
ncbi:surface lipoprotein assembly modifier [Pseudidiomarina woesei]|nr:surface lipoprotein assembly modifier [Pseudidiomarina woesei]